MPLNIFLTRSRKGDDYLQSIPFLIFMYFSEWLIYSTHDFSYDECMHQTHGDVCRNTHLKPAPTFSLI